jgi:hypothetical protein
MSIYVKPNFKLNPCPFCKSTDLTIRVSDDYLPMWVECENCEAQGPANWQDKEIDPIKAWGIKRYEEPNA